MKKWWSSNLNSNYKANKDHKRSQATILQESILLLYRVSKNKERSKYPKRSMTNNSRNRTKVSEFREFVTAKKHTSVTLCMHQNVRGLKILLSYILYIGQNLIVRCVLM